MQPKGGIEVRKGVLLGFVRMTYDVYVGEAKVLCRLCRLRSNGLLRTLQYHANMAADRHQGTNPAVSKRVSKPLMGRHWRIILYIATKSCSLITFNVQTNSASLKLS